LKVWIFIIWIKFKNQRFASFLKKIILLFSNGYAHLYVYAKSSASDGTSFHSYFVTKKVKTGVKRSHTGSQILEYTIQNLCYRSEVWQNSLLVMKIGITIVDNITCFLESWSSETFVRVNPWLSWLFADTWNYSWLKPKWSNRWSVKTENVFLKFTLRFNSVQENYYTKAIIIMINVGQRKYIGYKFRISYILLFINWFPMILNYKDGEKDKFWNVRIWWVMINTQEPQNGY
jgi:hypothetical protein